MSLDIKRLKTQMLLKYLSDSTYQFPFQFGNNDNVALESIRNIRNSDKCLRELYRDNGLLDFLV